MGSNVLGGGILFAAIALLWIVVLVPSFVRGRAFRAAEQNAARLQRTLRILAETAEVPEEHRVEATAKEALAHEKKLKIAKKNLEQARKQEQKIMRQKLKDERIKTQRAIMSGQKFFKEERFRSARLKPLRLVAATLSLLGLLTVVVSAVMAVMSALAAGVVFFAGFITFFVGVAALVFMAPGARKKTKQQTRAVTETVKTQTPIFAEEEKRINTHLEHLKIQQKAKEELARAKILAEKRAKARSLASEKRESKENIPGSILLNEKSAQPQNSLADRLQKMGVVDKTNKEDTAISDIDEILKRRREVG